MEEEIVKCLDCLLQAQPVQRAEAENKIEQLKQQIGFAHALTKIVVQSQNSSYHRQLASILLKTFIETNWLNTNDEKVQKERTAQIKKDKFEYLSQEFEEEEEEEEESAPTGPVIIIDEREKSELRALIPHGLMIEEKSIQGNISVCLGVIAKYDYPSLFPNLLSSLKELILSPNSTITAKYGALLSLEIIIHPDILSNEILEVEFQSINQFLLEVYSTNLPLVKKSSASILLSLVNWILNRRVEREDKLSEAGMLKKLLETIPMWFSQMSKDLSQLESLSPADIAVKILILQIVCLFIYSLPNTISAYPIFLTISWDILSKCQNFYYEGLVATDKLHGSSLFDFNCGESYSFDNLLLLVLEIFHAWLSKPNLRSLVYPIASELVYTLIYYQQITYHQLENYTSDPNEFVIDENQELYSTHSLSIRTSSNRLIVELIRHHSSAKNDQYIPSIIQSISKRILETQNTRGSHQSTDEWWKMRESALFAFGNSISSLCRSSAPSKKGKKGKSEKPQFCFPIEYFTSLQLDASHSNSFLCYRSLYCASQCSHFISDYNLILPFFEATTKCLSPSFHDGFMKIGAIKALKTYGEVIKPENYFQQLENILTGICYLSLNSESDTLYLLLDLLIKVLSSASKQPASFTPYINMLVDTTILLWKKFADDAYSNTYIIDIVQLLITGGNIDNFKAVISKIVPLISTILNTPEMMVEKVTSISLLSSIFRSLSEANNNNDNAQNYQEILTQLSNAILPLLFQTLFQYSEDGLIEAGIRCLKWYLVSVIKITNHKCTEFLSSIMIGNSSALQVIIQFIAKLLHPSVSDISASSVGGLINLLLSSSLPVLVQQNLLGQLIQTVLERLATAKLPDFQTGLVTVICRLILLGSDQMIDLLLNTSVSSASGISALQFFLRTLSKSVTNFISEYQNIITISTLSHLLLSGDQRVLNVTVPGAIINKPKRAGLRSSAKSQNTEEVWSEVPFIVKAFSILTDELIAIIDDENAKAYGGDFDGDDDFGEDDFDDYGDYGEDDFDELNDDDEWDAERFDDDDLDGYNLLSDLLDEGDDHGEGEEDEVLIPDDPLTKGLSPQDLLVSFFATFKNKDLKTFESLFQSSPPQSQKILIKHVLNAPKKKTGK